MTTNFYPFQVKKNHSLVLSASGKPKLGYAVINFLDTKDCEIYNLTGFSHRQFSNWVKKEFGYLRYQIEYGY